MRKDVIYLATNKTLYHTPKYNRIIKFVNRAFPDAQLIVASGLYKNPDDFYNKWPKIIRRITMLVFATDRNIMAFGTYQEIQDALKLGIPVYYITGDMRLIHINDIEMSIIDDGNDWVQFAKVKVAV